MTNLYVVFDDLPAVRVTQDRIREFIRNLYFIIW